ncbi:hypothetical protein F5051DRAFT_404844 [Lentinula edodes]|nr:hypothetical protein F5051DRAFT_404844 [Lentinula edodes]
MLLLQDHPVPTRPVAQPVLPVPLRPRLPLVLVPIRALAVLPRVVQAHLVQVHLAALRTPRALLDRQRLLLPQDLRAPVQTQARARQALAVLAQMDRQQTPRQVQTPAQVQRTPPVLLPVQTQAQVLPLAPALTLDPLQALQLRHRVPRHLVLHPLLAAPHLPPPLPVALLPRAGPRNEASKVAGARS